MTSWRDVRVTALSVSCSDGRFVCQTDAFLEDELGLAAHDRLAVPGGAAVLAGRPDEFRDADVLGENIRFLRQAHDLGTIILIAHEDCGFYEGRVGVAAPDMKPLQIEDLRKAAGRLRALTPCVEIRAFYARGPQDGVEFDPVDL